jgi:thiol-disulfide isomerase/thioredoxin
VGRAGRTAAVVALAAVAGVAAFYLSRAALAPEPAPSSAYVPPPPLAVKPAPIPVMRPDVTLADRDGKSRSLAEWNGKPQVINFWATWCAPCRREIPMLNALVKDPAFSGFTLIGIAIDFREDVLRYLAATPLDYTVLIGEEDGLDAARAFGMESLGLPFTAFVDGKGRIVTIHVGELHRDQADVILSVVRALDAGQIDMDTAQARIRAEVRKIG